MRQKQTQSFISKYILPYFNEWKVHDRFLFCRFDSHVLIGILLTGHTYPKNSFQVEVFAQPLYKPATSIVLNLSKRVARHGSEWHLATNMEEKIATELIKALKPVVEEITSRYGRIIDLANDPELLQSDNSSDLEYIAGAFVFLDQYSQALNTYKKILNVFGGDDSDGAPEWKRLKIGQLKRLLFLLQSTKYEEAKNCLMAFERETLTAIGLNGELSS